MNEEPTSKLPEDSARTEEARSSPVTGSALRGPSNPVLRDPEDFGSREFWKAANAHAVRRWAAEAEKVAQMQGLLDWAESLICNGVPMSHCTQDEWDDAVNKWRDDKHLRVGRFGSGLEAQNERSSATREGMP
jgi:hypothetical protein